VGICFHAAFFLMRIYQGHPGSLGDAPRTANDLRDSVPLRVGSSRGCISSCSAGNTTSRLAGQADVDLVLVVVVSPVIVPLA
jgi:hypothetical protein